MRHISTSLNTGVVAGHPSDHLLQLCQAVILRKNLDKGEVDATSYCQIDGRSSPLQRPDPREHSSISSTQNVTVPASNSPGLRIQGDYSVLNAIAKTVKKQWQAGLSYKAGKAPLEDDFFPYKFLLNLTVQTPSQPGAQFFQAAKLRGFCLVAFVLHGASACEQAKAHRHGRSAEEDDLHLQVASESPIESAISALDCVSDSTDSTLKRNTRMNTGTGGAEMMDADAVRMGQAEELNKEAGLHERRAQAIEDLKNQQKSRHAAAMKKIQTDLEEQEKLLDGAEAHAPDNKMRLQQQSAKHRSKEEVAALMQYPLLGFSMPSTLNPVQYLTKLRGGSADTAPQSNALKVGANPRTLGKVASRSLPQTRKDLEEQTELFGEDAELAEVAKKKGKSAHKHTPKKHAEGKLEGGKHEKKEPFEEQAEETTAEDDMDDDEDEESGAAAAIHQLQDAVAAPFADPVFINTPKGAKQQRSELKNSVQEPYAESHSRGAFAVETTVDDEKDDVPVEEKSSKAHTVKHADDLDGAGPAHKASGAAHSNHHGGCHANINASPLEANEAETAQARALQQSQTAMAQQALLQRDGQRASLTLLQSGDRSKAAISSARARFAATQTRASASSKAGQEKGDDEVGTRSKNANPDTSDMQPTPTQGGAQGGTALATEEAAAAAEADAAEKEAREAEASLEDEHKLLAAESEATDAKNGLRACAGGSFLNCRQQTKGLPPQRSRAARSAR
ncbi:hypothetical protein Efla_002822 [Eimeria flavescens]